MMCFRDMTFCDAPCGTVSCQRMLTDEVRAAARKWWGADDPPIAVSDLRDGCGKYRDPNEGRAPGNPADATAPHGPGLHEGEESGRSALATKGKR